MLLQDMGSMAKHHGTSQSTTTRSSSKRAKQHHHPSSSSSSSEVRSAAREKKSQQDDYEALQITFYEIESWIEKTTPVLARMTKELDKASRQFRKKRNDDEKHHKDERSSSTSSTAASQNPPRLFDSLSLPKETQTDKSMQWTLSFQPGNSLRLETNITSIEQLVEAVRKIRLLTEDPNSTSAASSKEKEQEEDEEAEAEAEEAATAAGGDESSTSVSIWVDPLETDPATEYWHVAIGRRPQTCLENYKHCEMNLSRLTEDVSPSVLNYICQVYWDCLHPKFSCDWYTFWDRSGDPKRNQVCIDSGLAIVFLHVIRHDKNACANALDIAYYYYDRAREALMDYFDSPDCATLETLMNLAMFCTVCKRHSQARTYISLAFRMMSEMGMHQRSQLPADRVLRKKYLKLFMVLYYNDVTASIYSGEPSLIMDSECDIDFYEIIELNKILYANGEGGCNDNMVVKETYFTHSLELARIGKRTAMLVRDYDQQQLRYHHTGELPLRWAKKVQAIELALSQWFDRLPDYYRVDPQLEYNTSEDNMQQRARHPMPPDTLQEQSGLLLMLQYQTQWILLHKTFLSPSKSVSPFTPPLDTPTSPSSPLHPPLPQQRTERSHAICTDASNRIVAIAEKITKQFGWCVCQQFVNCIYHASTIYCRNTLIKDEATRQHAKAMIYRIIRVLASTSVNYQGLPTDLTACLNEFLADHGMQTAGEGDTGDDEDSKLLLDCVFSHVSQSSCAYDLLSGFNDTLANSPAMYRQNISQHHPQQLASSSSLSPKRDVNNKMQDVRPSTTSTTTYPADNDFASDSRSWTGVRPCRAGQAKC